MKHNKHKRMNIKKNHYIQINTKDLFNATMNN